MKNSKWLLIVLVVLVGLSCGKNKIEDIEDPADNEGMLSLNVSPDFDWSMNNLFDFNFSGGSFMVVEITSADESVIYHRGSYIEDFSGTYNVSLKIPSHITEVKVNSELIMLGDGGTISYDFSTKAAPVNYKIDFNGTTSKVVVGDVEELDGASSFTIEAWAIVNDWTPTFNQNVFEKYDGSDAVAVVLTSTGQLQILCDGSSFALYTSTISDGDCFHFAVVFDGTGVSNADRLKLYIDGVEVALSFNGTIPATTVDMGSNDFYIGSGANGKFNGSFDEFRVWTTARSTSQVNDNMLLSLLGTEAGLLAYYQCNENTGTTLIDKVGNYDGTNTDVTWSENTCNNAATWLDDDFDGIPDTSDDYPEDPFRAYDVFWPTSEGTLAFEDVWPSFGDYDFNDLVVGYQFKTVKSATNRVVEIFSYTNVRANGAWLANGFGFELPSANNGLLTDLSVSGYNHSGSVVTLAGTGLEVGQTNPTIIVIDNITNVMGEWVNTIPSYQTESPVMITVHMTTDADYEEDDFNLNLWNPFIFIGQNRGHELHLANYPPTSLGSSSYFQTLNDSSVALSNRYYVSATNLPWALDIPITFAYPKEELSITAAYLHFRDWAEGSSAYDPWYGTTNPSYVEIEWRDTDMIYNP